MHAGCVTPAKVFFALILTLCVIPDVLADEGVFKYGLGISNGKTTTQIKTFSLSDEDQVIGSVRYSLTAGMWADQGKAQGRATSAFTSAQLGLKPDLGNVFVSWFVGPGAISRTDSALGGHLQFFNDLCAGVQDTHTSIGVCIKHVSSAGLASPNQGRDFALLRASVGF